MVDSGSHGQTLGRGRGKPLAKLFARTYGTFLIAASTSQQFAMELSDLEHGALAYTMLAGLGNVRSGPLLDQYADLDDDRIVTVRELVRYVEKQVPLLTAQYRERQMPVIFSLGQDFPLALR